MPDIPKFNSPLDYLGVSLLLLGIFLVLAGFKIIKIEKVSVAPGQKTCFFGLLLCAVGIVFLFPQIVGFGSVASLSPTTTPLPTDTSVVPTNTQVVPTDTSVTPIDTPITVSASPTLEPTTEPPIDEPTDTPTVVLMPDQFIRKYYEAINNRQYEHTWSMLSPNFKKEVNPTGFGDYVGWWDTVERVDIMGTEILDQNLTTASVYALLRYNMKDGRVQDSPNTFILVADTVGSSWLIEGQN